MNYLWTENSWATNEITPSVTVDADTDFGTNDIFADADGKIYLWLPNGTYSFTANGKSYTATVANGPTTAVAQ